MVIVNLNKYQILLKTVEEGPRYAAFLFLSENAAAIPCRQVLGSYVVRWERGEDPSEQGS